MTMTSLQDTRVSSLRAVGLLCTGLLTACPSALDGVDGSGSSSTGEVSGPTTATTANESTGSSGTTDLNSSSGTETASTSSGETSTGRDGSSSSEGNSSESSTGGSSPFLFSDASFEDYARVDRLGVAAVSTLLIASKDAYNQASPEDDAAGAFIPEFVDSVTTWHATLDDDLVALKLTPATELESLNTVSPLVVPDTIATNASSPSGFPNGRRPEDPVMDVLLAILLLDLSVHDAGTFVGVLNPTANDLPFSDTFPYFAAPH